MKKFKIGFTLAEIMIVLTIIGIISAIVMPNVGKLVSSENKNIARFKKGHNDLLQAVDILVKSDKYYVPGDFGLKPNGDLIDGSHTGDETYFCKSLADVFKTKSINCISASTSGYGLTALKNQSEMATIKESFDTECAFIQGIVTKGEIVTPDSIEYYGDNPAAMFGITAYDTLKVQCNDSSGNQRTGSSYSWCSTAFFERQKLYRGFTNDYFKEENSGFERIFKIFCMDVDGINNGEAPFGYGIRVDGRVMNGARAQEWVNKELGKKQ